MKRLVWTALCLTVSAALAATKPLYVTPADPLSVNQTFPGFIEVHGTWAHQGAPFSVPNSCIGDDSVLNSSLPFLNVSFGCRACLAGRG
jgi:hypothetical protein